MLALAVLRIHGARLEVLLGGRDGCAAELTAIGLSQRSDGHWEGPVQRLEPVCARLARRLVSHEARVPPDHVISVWSLANR